MGLLIVAFVLLFGACALAILGATRPRFRFAWLLALATALAAWLVALAMRTQLPSGLAIPLWESAISAASFANFAVTVTTWPIVLGAGSLALTLLLAAPSRPRFPDPANWAICLALASTGILALAADSPLTLILFWAALDLAEAGLLLGRLGQRSSTNQVQYAFSMRLGSIGLVMLAFVLGEPALAGATFADMQTPAALILLPGAALLRLAAFAAPWPKGPGTDDVGSMLQLTAGAASVGFLGQLPVSAGGVPLLLPCALATLYAGWMFLRAGNSIEARPLWILGLGSLAAGAGLQGNPTGATAWACAIFLVGGPLFVSSIADSITKRAFLIALWITSTLPFSLTAAAWSASGIRWLWIVPVFVVGQAMLMAGSFHQAASRQADTALRVEVVALRGLKYLGFALPLLVGVGLGVWGWPGAMQVGEPFVAVPLVLLTGGLVWAKRRLPLLNPGPNEWSPKWISATSAMLIREGSRAGLGLQRLARAVTVTMEGEAGIMWGLLFLALLVSLIVGRNP
jgi:hypothetical protein